MYRRIMVPLDGSKLAECVLPHVESVGGGCSAEEILLVTVTERVPGYHLVQDHYSDDVVRERQVPEAVGKMDVQGQKYLDRIAKGLKAKGLNVKTEVLMGDPAGEITFKAEHGECDLIIMASHGRTGPSRWAFGSVADKVFRASCVPVLMVRGPGCVANIK